LKYRWSPDGIQGKKFSTSRPTFPILGWRSKRGQTMLPAWPMLCHLDRIYKFFDGSQPSVLPSAPTPLGGGNSNDAYSPLWQLVKVTWLPGSVWTELRSEEEVLEAAETKRVSLERLPIIVNCPVVQVGDQLLPGTRRIR
jgi:hypothetical protein